ncbi:MAG: hypothetical protein QXX81_08495 [Zestosphaera sp.]
MSHTPCERLAPYTYPSNWLSEVPSRIPGKQDIPRQLTRPHTDVYGELRKAVRGRALVIGDDLTVTREDLISEYHREGFIDGAIVKVNQIGTYSEAEDAVRTLLTNGSRAIISYRSGETEDNTIAHIAVGLETGLIKMGAPAGGERTAKYNELLRIEDYLGDTVLFLKDRMFK